MSVTLERLQQLKRQAGGTLPVAQAAPAPSAAPALDHLRNLLRLRVPPPLRTAAQDRTLPGIELAPGLHYNEARHVDDAIPTSFDGAFDRKEALPASRLLFFDTETTGLAGGTGTRAFMIGAADWHQGSLRVRQLTISTMAAETAMLDAFRAWLAPDVVLVSYNGKCYDAPLLATRFRLARMSNPLAGLAHVDLLYPARRRYRGVYENCRLATIERQVLRIVREDDLPGSEAPAAWQSFLRGGCARNLRRVLAHNRQDVISLSRLLRTLAGAQDRGLDEDRQ
jgi:uncharacterized protein YprB with RNaseH-like and TPR domain